MLDHLGCEDDGFTLVELMMVVLIIGILGTIVLPTYLGAREQAQDRRAQANLGNAFITAKIWNAEVGAYAGFDEIEGESLEPSLAWVAMGDPAVGEVAVGLIAADIHLVAKSETGTFFCLHDDVGAGTMYGSATSYSGVDDETECASASW